MKITNDDKDLFVKFFTRCEKGKYYDGYILDFSDRTFKEFFIEKIHIDIFKKYENESSKKKKLSKFLVSEDLSKSLKIINALFERIKTHQLEYNEKLMPICKERLDYYVNLQKKNKKTKSKRITKTKKCKEISKKLDAIYKIDDAQKRGYAFEDFLNYYFTLEGLKPREPFKINGQQVDGSIELNKSIYLIEAKWKKTKTSKPDVVQFQKKVEERSGITRGIFISLSGYSDEAINPSGLGKTKIILVEVEEIKDILNKRVSLKTLLEYKVRLLAEEGKPFYKYVNKK